MPRRTPVVKRINQWTWEGKPVENPERCDAPLQPEACGFRHTRIVKGIRICNRIAKYRIGRRVMCRKHAALFALDELDPEVP